MATSDSFKLRLGIAPGPDISKPLASASFENRSVRDAVAGIPQPMTAQKYIAEQDSRVDVVEQDS